MTASQPYMSGVSQTVTPMLTAVTSTSSPPTTSQPTPSAPSSGSTFSQLIKVEVPSN